MSRKDYVLIAQALREGKATQLQIEIMIKYLRSTNSNFDAARFARAASHEEN